MVISVESPFDNDPRSRLRGATNRILELLKFLRTDVEEMEGNLKILFEALIEIKEQERRDSKN